jgi:inner membrane protein
VALADAVIALQYALVGLALSMFFLLLLALSEHLGFDAAYWVASAALVGLTGVYLGGALKSRARGWVAAAGFATLYGVLFVILNAAESALLIGALCLFAVLAAMMLITRRVDWNAIGRQGTNSAGVHK